MTRRTLLVPLFAAALILAPAKVSGKLVVPPTPDPGLATRPGSSMEVGSTGLYRWSAPIYREALGLQGRSA